MNFKGKISTAALLLATVMLADSHLEAGAQAVAEQAITTQKKGVTTVQVAAKTSMKASKAQAVKTAAASDLIPAIIKRVSPSVVGIIGEAASGDYRDGSSNGSGDNSASSDKGMYDLAHGTGVIIKSDGWIITNAHVINGIDNATVVTSSGKEYTIEESYIDEVSDLALIRINATGLKPAKLAPDSRVTQVGDKVIALGTPVSFSLRGSATEGIVSGLNRAINVSYRLIQTDAAINPGNSGGPLLNMQGEVIGINSMKYEAVGVENMGFSIPADTVRYVIHQLFQYGEVLRPSLGLELEEGWSAEIGLPSNDPLTVISVNSAAAKAAGIQEGDVIYKLNNTPLSSLVDLNEMLKKFKPGQTVTLWMQSKGDIVKHSLVLTTDRSSESDSGDN
ncbi:S1C family serine protease [Paenibacillus caui]|uniref:S1C family serine protease n=1 Tax=Paenibacillus caui TaxID=2873927 RepID=UPI001CA9EE70|nr:trypsin-like peptidase domain-containing protein [Paenibacillus caui]